MERRILLRMACGAVLALAAACAGAVEAPLVAAASDLKYALDEIVAQYERSTQRTVRVVYGSSGNFAHQIEQGAPFEVYLSADESYVEALAQQGLTQGSGALYAVGRLVLYAGRPAAFEPDPQLAGLREALAQGKVGKFAIANPEHAPYGRAAREALQAAGLWGALQSRFVLGENVSQAAQFAASGNAQGGIFALSLALAPNFAARGSYAVLPQNLHRPLRQRMVLLRRASTDAKEFYRYLSGAEAREVFKRYGFVLPDE